MPVPGSTEHSPDPGSVRLQRIGLRGRYDARPHSGARCELPHGVMSSLLCALGVWLRLGCSHVPPVRRLGAQRPIADHDESCRRTGQPLRPVQAADATSVEELRHHPSRGPVPETHRVAALRSDRAQLLGQDLAQGSIPVVRLERQRRRSVARPRPYPSRFPEVCALARPLSLMRPAAFGDEAPLDDSTHCGCISPARQP